MLPVNAENGQGELAGRKSGTNRMTGLFYDRILAGCNQQLNRQLQFESSAIKISGSHLPGPSNRARYRKFLWTLAEYSAYDQPFAGLSYGAVSGPAQRIR
jgi:hypothetical protein